MNHPVHHSPKRIVDGNLAGAGNTASAFIESPQGERDGDAPISSPARVNIGGIQAARIVRHKYGPSGKRRTGWQIEQVIHIPIIPPN